MGNTFAKDPNQLDFKGIRTENFSDEIPYLNKLQIDSNRLANEISNSNSSDNTINNREMYNMFNQQETDNDYSDTSTLISNGNVDSVTSAANTEIKELLNKIQKGGSLESDVNNEPVNLVDNSIILQLLTETSKNQVGGNSQHTFLNEEMLSNLMTESNKQTGGFFWNKKKNESNETFINQETFKNLMENNDPNATSEVNTEFNNYMNNAITELTSALENNTQKGGNGMSSSEEDSSSSDSPEKSAVQSIMDSPSQVESETMEAVEIAAGKKSDENMMSTGRNDYESSSAHSNEIDSNNSNASTTISANNDKYLSDSINTSDINMISVE